jgi:excisionase family DNA binding protein
MRPLYEAVVLNSLEALHNSKVSSKLYKNTTMYTMQDLIDLDKEYRHIQELQHRLSVIRLPEYITPKQCAELLGCSTSTIYRALKSGKLLGQKVNNRWQIFTDVNLIELAA